MVKNPPCNAGSMGSIPGQGTKILHGSEQLSLCATTRESMCYNQISHVTKNQCSQINFVVVQSLSCVGLFAPPVARQATLSFTISRNLLKFMSLELMMPCKHLILCYPFLLLPSIFPSIRLFSKESVLCIRWPKYWRFSISPSSEYQG